MSKLYLPHVDGNDEDDGVTVSVCDNGDIKFSTPRDTFFLFPADWGLIQHFVKHAKSEK